MMKKNEELLQTTKEGNTRKIVRLIGKGTDVNARAMMGGQL
jgi:hypothetical protein